ncbi:MAG: UvrD-helicase domain-containing protein [Bacteroidales bacterium]|nr:UvrD-helicase domain-containing protein [Bacteroidales bacterium]
MLKIYRSGAGSGKTYQLSIIYLSLILSRPQNFRHILGITFTNKAAAELKERILYFLVCLSSEKPCERKEQILNSLKKEGLNLSEREIKDKARETLGVILHNYGEFAISTIDSFMHKVVSSFTFDLHIAHDFGIILETTPLAEETADRLLDKAGKDEAVTLLLEIVLESLIDDEKGWNIRALLRDTTEKLFREDTRHHLHDLLSYNPGDLLNSEKQLRKSISTRLSNIRTLAQECLQLIRKHDINPDDFAYGAKGVGAWLKKISLLEANNDTPPPSNNYVLNATENDTWFGKANQDLWTRFQPIRDTVRNNILQIIELTKYINSLRRIAQALPGMAIMSALSKELESLKREENFLHISDFNELIRNIIVNEPVPYIYYRLGNRFRHFLLDEFQDTSVSQWHNLVPLLANSLAENSNLPSAIIVGDGKQSIYRFRNGELMIFEALPEIYQKPDSPAFRDAEGLFQAKKQFTPLKENYRSEKHVVEFNNSFFQKIEEILGPSYPQVAKVFSDLHQTPTRNEDKGYVEWNFIASNDDQEKLEPQALQVLQKIKQLHEAGYAWKDMAVLVRRGKEGQAVASALSSEGIPVMSADSLLLHTSRQIRQVIAWLYFLQNPSDEFYRAQVLSFYSRPDKDLDSLMHEHTKLESLTATFLSTDASTLLQKNLYSLCEYLLASAFTEPSTHAHGQTFLEYVQRLIQQKKHSPKDLLEAWEESGHNWSVSLTGESDAVQIMTIHKAKGLEFNIVFIPFLFEKTIGSEEAWLTFDKNKYPHDFSNLVLPDKLLTRVSGTSENDALFGDELDVIREKQLLDRLNLLYVAFTRAKERLYLFSAPFGKSTSDDLKTATQNALSKIMQPIDDGTLVYPRPEKELFTQPRSPSACETTQHSQLFPIELHAWDKRFKIRNLARENELTTTGISPRKRGIAIHHLLQRLLSGGTSPELMAENEKGDPQWAALKDAWEIIQKNELYPKIFTPDAEYLTEYELLIPGKGTLRPDLLIIHPEVVKIVDYKTGAPDITHKKQILEYAEALSAAGFPAVEGYLVYLNERIGIVQVPSS